MSPLELDWMDALDDLRDDVTEAMDMENAEELERLRARVAELEDALKHILRLTGSDRWSNEIDRIASWALGR